MGVTADGLAPAVRVAYGRLAGRPARTVCALLVVGAVLSGSADVSVPQWLRYLPLLASVVLLGLPHGAIDYLVPARVAGVSPARSALAVGVLYAVVGGAYALLWFLTPALAAVCFIAVTWFHWGQGDVHALVTFEGGSHLDTRSLRAATCVVRGGVPMLVPLLASPERYLAVVGTWVGLFGRELSAPWLLAWETRALLGGAFLSVTLLALAAGYRRGGWSREWRVDAGETALLWLFFLTVPPLVAIGVYFCVWHSLRHILRFAAADAPRRSVRGVFSRFAGEAALPTALALLLLVGFGLAVPVPLASVETLAGLYLVFIAVLTLPHVVVVTWMDREEGVWHG